MPNLNGNPCHIVNMQVRLLTHRVRKAAAIHTLCSTSQGRKLRWPPCLNRRVAKPNDGGAWRL